MYSKKFLDELLAKNDIVSVISKYVPLKPVNGSSAQIGECPFHKRKADSLYVVPEAQIYHCFACKESGNVINFIMAMEKLSFVEAVEFLAKQADTSLSHAVSADTAMNSRRQLALHKDAARYFYSMLRQSNNPTISQYCKNRGLTRQTLIRFGLGYAPDSFHGLTNAMQAKGYSEEELLAAGLVRRNAKGRLYDFFRNRLMFPIFDIHNNVIAFGGRVLDDSKPKYLNSPETPIFSKGCHLFALNRAKTTKSDFLLLAEGYMDVIALHQAGFDSAVASLGTSLTEKQAALLSRYTDKVIVVYDADKAGQAAAKRAVSLLEQAGVKAAILSFLGAKDPDEFIQKNGADAFQQLLARSVHTL